MNTPLKGKEALAAAVAAALSVWTAQARAEGPHAYIGGAIGESTLDINGHADGLHYDVNDSDTGYRIFGGYMFNDYLGIEASYVNFGEMNDNFGFDGGEGRASTEAKGNGHTIEGVLAYPFGPVSVFAKVGSISFNGKAKVSGDIQAKQDYNSSDWMFGGGISYNIGHFSLRAEGDYYDVGDTSDLYLLSVGAQFNFSLW